MSDSGTLKAWVSGTNPRQYVTDDELNELGVKYWTIDTDNWEKEGKLNKICEERQYYNLGLSHLTKEQVLDLNAEHLHEQDEVLFFLSGSGFIELRGKDNRWVHLPIVKGFFYVFAAGLYHRLRLEVDDVERLDIRANSKLDPNKTGSDHHYRNGPTRTDDLLCRNQYLRRLKTGNFP